MRIAVLALAAALACVLAGTRAVGEESSVSGFTASDRGGAKETILFNAEREPGRGVAVSVTVPALEAGDVATARVVLKRGETPVAGVPLGAVKGGRGASFEGVAPDAGEWTTALVLVEKADRALLIKEFPVADLDLGLPFGEPIPGAPGAPEPMSAGERAAKSFGLVIKEGLLLPGPLDRLLFG